MHVPFCPVGPCCPCGPVGPCSPCTPTSPRLPVSPRDPFGPVAPDGPDIPALIANILVLQYTVRVYHCIRNQILHHQVIAE